MASRPTTLEEIGERLRATLKKKRISQRGLAAILSPDNPEAIRSQVNKWARGKHAPEEANARRLAKALGVHADYFFLADQPSRPTIMEEVLIKLDDVLARLKEVDRLRDRLESVEALGAENGALLRRVLELNVDSFASIGDVLGIDLPPPQTGSTGSSTSGEDPESTAA